MGKFKDWRIKREAKRILSGKRTFSEWLQDKIIYLHAKREIKRLKKKEEESK